MEVQLKGIEDMEVQLKGMEDMQVQLKGMEDMEEMAEYNRPLAYKLRNVNWLMTSHPDYFLACADAYLLYGKNTSASPSTSIPSLYVSERSQ